MSTAKQIWEDLAARFSQHNIPRLLYLRKDLASLKQDTLSITEYFTKFRCLIDELDNLSPIPKCICQNSNYLCENVKKLADYE